jgi:hypothetical protein
MTTTEDKDDSPSTPLLMTHRQAQMHADAIERSAIITAKLIRALLRQTHTSDVFRLDGGL